MTIGLKNLYIGLVTDANVAVYTPPGTGGVSAKINSASVYNDDTSDVTIDVYIVASGGAGAAAVSNQLYNDKNVPTKTSIDLDLLRGKNIIGTGSLVVKASVTNKLTLAVSGLEVS